MGILRGYLAAYNGLSSVLWLLVTIFAVNDAIGYLRGDSDNVYVLKRYEGFPHKFLFYVQILNAVIEIGNAVTGLVKSPLATLFLQFSARLGIVWGISYHLPWSPGNYVMPAYVGLSIAWGVTEIVRYSFYLLKLLGDTPKILVWLRYSLFLVLYPIGLVCESCVVYNSLGATETRGYFYFLLFSLTIYVPGFLFLYSYMLKQRRKVLGKGKKD